MTKDLKNKVLRITPADIIDRIVEPQKRYSKIDKVKRAEVIIDKAILNKSIRELSKDKELAHETIFKIIDSNRELIDQIVTDKAKVLVSKEERIVASLFVLIEKKVRHLLKDDKFDKSKLSELTAAVKDLRNEIRLNKGEPTSISAKYKDKDSKALKEALIKRVTLLKDGNELELLQATFKKE